MGIQSLPNHGGNAIDVTKLTPFGGESSLVGTGAWQTLLSVTGKGFINTCVIANNLNAAGMQLKITIDGVLKLLQQSGALANIYIGLVQKNDLYTISSAGDLGVRGYLTKAMQSTPIIKPFPDTGNANNMALAGYPIYFKQSLLIEVLNASGAITIYRYDGGS